MVQENMVVMRWVKIVKGEVNLTKLGPNSEGFDY